MRLFYMLFHYALKFRAIRFEKRFALLDLRYVLFPIFFVIAFPARCGY